MMAYMGTGFKNFSNIHNTLAIEMNRCLQETNKTEIMTKEKTTQIKKDPPKRNPPKNTDP